MVYVFLKNQKIRANVGWYKEERIKGVDLVVSVTVGLKNKASDDEIRDTVDYVLLLNIVRQECSVKRKLLETLGESILLSIEEKAGKLCASAEIEIHKKSIEAEGFNAESVGIVIKKSFE